MSDTAKLLFAIVDAACEVCDADPNRDMSRYFEALEKAVRAWRKHLRKYQPKEPAK